MTETLTPRPRRIAKRANDGSTFGRRRGRTWLWPIQSERHFPRLLASSPCSHPGPWRWGVRGIGPIAGRAASHAAGCAATAHSSRRTPSESGLMAVGGCVQSAFCSRGTEGSLSFLVFWAGARSRHCLAKPVPLYPTCQLIWADAAAAPGVLVRGGAAQLPCFGLLIQQRLACSNFAAALAPGRSGGQNPADVLLVWSLVSCKRAVEL